MRLKLSIYLKVVIVLCSFIGVYLSIQSTSNYQSSLKSLMYFTVQSNIWIGVTALFLLIVMILEIIMKKEFRKKYMYIIKHVFTVAISLTGLVFCAFLAPTAKGYDPWSFSSVLTHAVVPFSAFLDFFVDEYKFEIKNKDVLYCLLPPLYYLGFALVCYIADFKFSDGNNYPYFFMNFGSKAGIFGFSDDPLYFMGTFYWMVILALIVSLFGYFYKVVHQKINK